MTAETENNGSGWSVDDDEIDTGTAENDDDTPDGTGASSQETDDDEEGGDETEGAGKPKGRDRSYRKRAQAAEAEATKLRAAVEGFQRREAERVAGAKMADPSDLWRYDGGDLAQFVNADGELDTEALTAHVDALLTNRPHLARTSFKRRPQPDKSQGSKAGAGSAKATWADVVGA